MQNFVQEGENLTLTAPYNVASGGGFLVGSIFAVAAQTALSGASVVGVTEGVFDLTKDVDSATFSAGTLAYWDNSNKEVTNEDSGNKLIGVAVSAAIQAATTVRVRLNGAFVG